MITLVRKVTNNNENTIHIDEDGGDEMMVLKLMMKKGMILGSQLEGLGLKKVLASKKGLGLGISLPACFNPLENPPKILDVLYSIIKVS